MDKKHLFAVLIPLLVLVLACAQQQETPKTALKSPAPESDKEKVIEKVVVEQPKSPVLTIVSPKDSELIKSSNVTIQLDAENFNIVPVGSPVKDNEGHFHVWLDSNKKVTTDKITIFDNVVSGKHTIVAELVKSNHSSLSQKVTKLITINVESDYVPKAETPQPGMREYAVEADDHGFYPSTIKAKIGELVRINFSFRDDSIYFGGLDVKGPFPTIQYKLKGEQPLAAEFTMKGETKITSYWPSSGVKKAELIVEVGK